MLAGNQWGHPARVLSDHDGAGMDRVQDPQPFEVWLVSLMYVEQILARVSRSHLASARNEVDASTLGRELSENSR